MIEAFSREEFVQFVSLAPDPSLFDVTKQREHRFDDETDHPLSREQMLYLKYRYGVYFPWKVCYDLLENDHWEDKHSGHGKAFSAEARREFPKTVAFLDGLPFWEIGRAVIFGIEANDHAPLHRDSEPGRSLQVAQVDLVQSARDQALLPLRRGAGELDDGDYPHLLVQRHGLPRCPFGPVLPLLGARRRHIRARILEEARGRCGGREGAR